MREYLRSVQGSIHSTFHDLLIALAYPQFATQHTFGPYELLGEE